MWRKTFPKATRFLRILCPPIAVSNRWTVVRTRSAGSSRRERVMVKDLVSERVTRFVVAIALAAGTLLLVAVQPANAYYTPGGCGDVLFVGARGSGQPAAGD